MRWGQAFGIVDFGFVFDDLERDPTLVALSEDNGHYGTLSMIASLTRSPARH